MNDASTLLSTAVTALGGSYREGQSTMAATVEHALTAGQHALIQAGTGTGKSLAYLVPAVARAVMANERIVVSTATLALQRQVFAKDLPMVIDALADDLTERARIALFKGRSNYLCVHKMAGGYGDEEPEELPGLTGPTSGLGREVARLHAWSEDTDTGDRDDLVPGVSPRAWAQVSVTGRECLESRCPALSQCFSQRAREEAAAAHVVVTNHAVLGVQATSHDLLGEHHALIVDEAHELVTRITSSATHELTVARVERAASAARRAGAQTEDLDRAARSLVTALEEHPSGRVKNGLEERLAVSVATVSSAARAVLSAVQSSAKTGGDDKAAVSKMATAALTEIVDVADVLVKHDDAHVIWIAQPEDDAPSNRGSRLMAAPVNVADLIRDRLVHDRPAVFTSATLALGGGFDAIAAHLGIEEPVAVDVGSPFDYARQGIVYVAAGLPRPQMSGISDAALDELADLITAAGGRTLGLFSSHRAALVATEAMRERLDVPVLYQRDDQLPTLLSAFRDDPRTCLFGSTSLWQGVDVPGDTCSLVVIDRIPFPRPDDPITQARVEAADASGQRGFMAVSATHAALLMAQGSGRLIRSMDDRGVVAVLDPRMVTARYGAFLGKSMPPLWPTTDRTVVLDALRRLDALAAAAHSSA